MRESAVERYLVQRVKAAGGRCEKVRGVRNFPDRIVIWPPRRPGGLAVIDFVELKAPGGQPRPGQVREHARLRAMGCNVMTISTKPVVEAYVRHRSIVR